MYRIVDSNAPLNEQVHVLSQVAADLELGLSALINILSKSLKNSPYPVTNEAVQIEAQKIIEQRHQEQSIPPDMRQVLEDILSGKLDVAGVAIIGKDGGKAYVKSACEAGCPNCRPK